MSFKSSHICFLLLASFLILPSCEQYEDEFFEDDDELLDTRATIVGRYQAENYTFQKGCQKRTNNPGYTKNGYMDYGGNGSLVEWNNVRVKSAGRYALKFRYANGSRGDRKCVVTVNNNSAGSMRFSRTGSWARWNNNSLEVRLKAGINKIRVTASTGAGGPNLDKMDVISKSDSGDDSGGGDGCNLPMNNGNYCSDPACGPCGVGQGDCDRDSDCRGDLVCRSKSNGGDPAQSGLDICVRPGSDNDGDDEVDNSDQWKEGDPNIEAEGKFVLFHNGQQKGVSCASNGARPKIVSSPRVWRVFVNRRLKDMTSGLELDCPEGVYRCTCRGQNQGEWFHGGNEKRGLGPVHNSLLPTNQGRPIYPDADGRYIHICLTVDGQYLTAADNDPGVCSKFTFKNWRKTR